MLRFVLRRIVLLVPVVLALTVVVFAIARLLPGDPARLAAGPHASATEIAEVTREFGLDLPLPVQYATYVRDLLLGDWGKSILTRRPVIDDLRSYLPATLELVFAAMVLAVGLGLPAGIVAAVWRNRWPDVVS